MWIGLLGSGLVVLAVIAVVISRWDEIGKIGRAAGLVALAVGVLAAALKLRKVAPSTADLLAHLDDVLIGAAGIGVMSAFGFGWPTCLTVGGVLAAGSAVWLDRRWDPSRFGWFEVIAIAVASFGAAALTHTTVGLLVVIAALGESLLGRFRRAAGLAMLATFSPVLYLLTIFDIGPGTIVDAGAAGPRLIWSAPIAGVISGVTLLRVGKGLGDPRWRGLAAAALTGGVATGMAASDLNEAAVWLSIPPVALLLAEAMRVGFARTSEQSSNGWVSTTIAVAVQLQSLVFGLVTIIGSAVLLIDWRSADLDPPQAMLPGERIEWMALPALFCLIATGFWWWRLATERAVAATGAHTWQPQTWQPQTWQPQTWQMDQIVSVTVMGVLVPVVIFAFGAPPAAVAPIAAAVVAVVASESKSVIPTYLVALFAAVLVVIQRLDADLEWLAFGEMIGLALIVTLVSAWGAFGRGRGSSSEWIPVAGNGSDPVALIGSNLKGFFDSAPVPVFEMATVAIIAAALVAATAPIGIPLAAMLVAVSAITAVQVGVDRRAWIAQIISLGTVGGVALLLSLDADVGDFGSLAVGWGAVAASGGWNWYRRRSLLSSLGAGVAVLLASMSALLGVGVDRVGLCVAFGALGIALVGSSHMLRVVHPVIEWGIGATSMGLWYLDGPHGELPLIPILEGGSTDWIQSLFVIALGLEVVVLARAIRQNWLAVGGLAAAVGGALSLTWTTPMADVLVRVAERIGVRPGDLVLLTVTIVALGVGGAARVRWRISSWFAFAPGLVIGGSWLALVSLDRGTVWAFPLGIVLGVGALVVGAWGRLGAPLVLGTGIVGAMVLTSYYSYLGDVPTWVWLGLGGGLLLGVAVLVERGSRRGMTLRDLIEGWD